MSIKPITSKALLSVPSLLLVSRNTIGAYQRGRLVSTYPAIWHRSLIIVAVIVDMRLWWLLPVTLDYCRIGLLHN